jgi:hypothetical protein
MRVEQHDRSHFFMRKNSCSLMKKAGRFERPVACASRVVSGTPEKSHLTLQIVLQACSRTVRVDALLDG